MQKGTDTGQVVAPRMLPRSEIALISNATGRAGDRSARQAAGHFQQVSARALSSSEQQRYEHQAVVLVPCEQPGGWLIR